MSPLLANILLDDLDKQLETRKLPVLVYRAAIGSGRASGLVAVS